MPWRACEHESSDERHRACPSCIGPARAKGSRCGPQRSGLGRTWRAPTRFAHGKEGSFAKGARTRAGARPSRRLHASKGCDCVENPRFWSQLLHRARHWRSLMGAQSSVPWPDGAPNAKDTSSKLSRNVDKPDDSELFDLGVRAFHNVPDEILDSLVPPDPISVETILRPAANREPSSPAFGVTKVAVLVKEETSPAKGYGKTFLRIRLAHDAEETDPLFQSVLSETSTRFMQSFTRGLYASDSAYWPVDDVNTMLRFELWGRQGLLSAAEVSFTELVAKALDKSPRPGTWKAVHKRLTEDSAYPFCITGATLASVPHSAVKVEFEVCVSVYGLAGLGVNVRREGLQECLQKRTEERELAALASARAAEKAEKAEAKARATETVKVELPMAMEAVTTLEEALTLQPLLSTAWRTACHRDKEWPGTDTSASILLRPHSAALLRLCQMCEGAAPADAAPGSAFAFVWETLVAWHAAVNLIGFAGFAKALETFFAWATAHDVVRAHAFYESVQQSVVKWSSLPEHMLKAKVGTAGATESTAMPPGTAAWLESFTWPPGAISEQVSEALDFRNRLKPAERFRTMGRLFEGRAARWAPAHSEALRALVAYGAAEAKNHTESERSLMDLGGKHDATRAYWEAVARFVLKIAHARQGHPACAPLLDPCFQSPDANFLVDGIGVNHRIIPLSREDFATVHKMYYWRVPQTTGPTSSHLGPWYPPPGGPIFKDWTPGGWIYAVQ